MHSFLMLFFEQLIPSFVIWFAVFFCLRRPQKLSSQGAWRHLSLVGCIAFSTAIIRQGLNIQTMRPESADVLNAWVFPLLVAFVLVFTPLVKRNGS
jgi:hypothetical protein